MNKIDITPHLEAKIQDELQIVVIDNFYDAAIAGDACPWLGKLFRFKVNSYLASYPYGMLPFGAADLVGTHWFLCRKTRGTRVDDLEPIMGIKMIDSGRTKTFRIPFPAFGYVSDPELEAHRHAIEHELERAHKEGHALGYVGSWAIDAKVRNDEVLSKICKKMTSSFISQWICTFNIQSMVSFANLRFHVEKFHTYLGLVRLVDRCGDHLTDFKMNVAFDQPYRATVFYRKNHTKEALQDMYDMQNSALWESRIIIASEQSPLYVKESSERAA